VTPVIRATRRSVLLEDINYLLPDATVGCQNRNNRNVIPECDLERDRPFDADIRDRMTIDQRTGITLSG
jgi:hypothetical protein